MNIKVVGWRGPKTELSILNAQAALSELESEAAVEWISSLDEIMRLGVVHMPALFINGKLKTSGRIPSVHEITRLLEEELVQDLAA
ncbi:MAG: thioredoxin family protein [Ignavibacteriae bacterium]|nr:thioredoxin family protein [Ignavibacteriota bacterium]